GARRHALVSKARRAMPPTFLRARALDESRASVLPTVSASPAHHVRAHTRAPHFCACARSFDPSLAAAGRLPRGALLGDRSQSPGSSNAVRACLRECGGSLRAQTRRPALWVLSPRACPRAHVQSFLSRAWLVPFMLVAGLQCTRYFLRGVWASNSLVV